MRAVLFCTVLYCNVCTYLTGTSGDVAPVAPLRSRHTRPHADHQTYRIVVAEGYLCERVYKREGINVRGELI